MSKEVFLLPSAKQILAYENGDIRSDEISTVYRFNFLSTFIWIEPSKNGYDIKIRGRWPTLKEESTFIANSRVISSAVDLFTAVTFFAATVRDILFLYDIHCRDSLAKSYPFGVNDVL